ncbi:MAG: hypothetical protein ACK2UO_20715 [Caldilineaceae bacterium]|jgi:hypothetical protein
MSFVHGSLWDRPVQEVSPPSCDGGLPKKEEEEESEEVLKMKRSLTTKPAPQLTLQSFYFRIDQLLE